MRALVAFPMRMGYSKSLAEWLIEPGGSPPVITHRFASEELSHGDIWKIYLGANEPDGDMRHFVCVFNQVGYGPYSSDYVVIKKRHREKMKGYLNFFSSGGAGLWLPEWTQLSLTVHILDKGGNVSNKLIFPLVLSRGAKQGPPPPPFYIGGLDKLGTKHVLDLTGAVGKGYEAWVVFVCQREDARLLSPNKSVDPRFAEALKMGYGLDLKVFAINCEVTERETTLKDRIPVIL